jgi:hypothetical protein
MTPEALVNQEIAQALMHFHFCVLPDPKDLHKLSVSPWSLPDLSHHIGIAWRQNTGALAAGRRFVRFGIPGAADWTGWIFGSGRRFQIEAKSAKGTLSRDQVANRDLCAQTGVLWGLARSYDDAVTTLECWGLKRSE